MKTTDLRKMEEMHPWKLSEEEEGRGSPPLAERIMVYVDWRGQAMVGEKEERGRKC